MSDPKSPDKKPKKGENAKADSKNETTDRKVKPAATTTDATAAKDQVRAPYRLPSDNPFTNAWKYAGIVGAIGLGASAFGYTTDARRFAFSYLFAFLFFLTIALGALFFTLVQHLTSAGWSVTVRRTSEFFGRGIVVFAILFVPVWFGMGQLFPWFHGGAGGHEAPHAEVKSLGAAHEVDPASQKKILKVDGSHDDAESHAAASNHEAAGGDPDEVLEERILRGKSPYLNVEFFTGRAIFYFLAWAFLGLKLFSFSTKQDQSKDPKLTVGVQRFAPPAMVLFGVTLTFAAFDWIMSLQQQGSKSVRLARYAS
ncbi:MAG: hypothetical protein ABIP39_13825, partial [Polyangiaceae bacterium]